MSFLVHLLDALSDGQLLGGWDVLGRLGRRGRLGYGLSTFADSADSAQPMIQLVTFPLFFISGIWIPLSELPEALQVIAKIFPVEHVADLVHRAYVGSVATGPVLLDFAILLAWAVVGATVATRRFVWMPPRKG